MSTPNYMDHLNETAEQLSASRPTLWPTLQRSWEQLEGRAAVMGWDVLANDEIVRSMAHDLARLLYTMPEASAAEDCAQLRVKNAEYGGSWHKRGGCGAFMMLARKWDRLEEQMRHSSVTLEERLQRGSEGSSEAMADTVGDLRRYLVLVLAWHAARKRTDDIPF